MAHFSVSTFKSCISGLFKLNSQLDFDTDLICCGSSCEKWETVRIKSVVRKKNGVIVLLDIWGQEVNPASLLESDLHSILYVLEQYPVLIFKNYK